MMLIPAAHVPFSLHWQVRVVQLVAARQSPRQIPSQHSANCLAGQLIEIVFISRCITVYAANAHGLAMIQTLLVNYHPKKATPFDGTQPKIAFGIRTCMS